MGSLYVAESVCDLLQSRVFATNMWDSMLVSTSAALHFGGSLLMFGLFADQRE